MDQISFPLALIEPYIKIDLVAIIIFIISLTLLLAYIIDDANIIAGVISLYSAVLVIPCLWAPQGYILTNKRILIKRLIGDLTINFIEEPERWAWTWWGIRLFASGGLYGYFGLFSFKGIGRVWMYATNRHNLVLIKTSQGKKILLSPKDPEEFIKLTRSNLS